MTTRNNLTIKVFSERIYARGGGEFVRTIPTKGVEAPYVAYIKTTLGEAKVKYDNKVVFEVLVNGSEITSKEYEDASLIVLNIL